jgi:hypothetical protein
MRYTPPEKGGAGFCGDFPRIDRKERTEKVKPEAPEPLQEMGRF